MTCLLYTSSHFFADDVITGIFYGLHVADAVGVMADKASVFVYDRVDSADDPGSGGEFVAEGDHEVFIRHGQVETAGTEDF